MAIQAASLFALVGVTGAGQSVRDLQSVSNQVNKTQSTMSQLGKNAGQMGKGMVQVGSGLLRIAEVASAAALVTTIGAAKIGITFQQQMELIHTQAGATQAEVDAQSRAVQSLVHTVGVGPEALARAMYHIESVGVRGAAALDILKASALGAKVGLADMESVTNALTAVWFSGIKGAKSMTDAMAILDGIVGVGNMHLQDLTDSFRSGILGTAATYSVDIRSLGAAIATLTDAGVPADIAATRLNNTLTHLAAPVPGAIKVLKGLGLSQFQLAGDLRKPDGIFMALQDLHDHLVAAGEIKNGLLTPQGAADMSKLFGGSRFGATAMQLLTQMDRVQQKYDLINARSMTFGDNVAKTMETAGFKFAQLRADIEESALAFAEGFLPALARAGTRLDTFLVGHQSDLRHMGVELGAWIDKIDWQKVENGANSFVGILRTMLDVISKVPPEVDLAVVGFLTLNKLSGGLLGKGIENIAGGALGILGTLGKAGLRGLLSKVPVVGGAAAALTSTPVYITGIAPGVGFGLGGGLPGAVGAAETAGGGLLGKALRLIPWVAFGALIAEGFIQGNKDHPEAYGTGTGGGVLPTGTSPNAARALPGATWTPASAYSAVTAGGFDSRLRESSVTLGGFDKRLTESNITLGGFDKRMTGAGNAIVGMSSKLKKELGMDLHTMLSGIEKRSAARYGHTLGPAAVQATFGRDLLGTEKRILSSHMAAKDQLSGLRHLEQLAVQGKDWGVAAKLKTDINSLKTRLSSDVTTSGHRTSEAIRRKRFSVTVPITSITTVSLRDITLNQKTFAKLGHVYVD